jgi:5-formyltetrahydrofolate cyclo-ligase
MKPTLREHAQMVLAGFPATERARMGGQIAGRVWEVEEVAGARTLLVYAGLPREVPTAEIVAEAARRDIRIVYPRCLPQERDLALHVVRDPAELVAGSFGILEPLSSCPAVATTEVDAALVPGLLWDRTGARLGRGAGYYDRLLRRPDWRGFSCGLFFAAQEVPEIPIDPWDAHLDAIVTELETVRTPRMKDEG